MDSIDIPIRYWETSMNTSYAISPESFLDAKTCTEICDYGIYKFKEELGLTPDELEVGGFPFMCQVRGLNDDKGQPKKAKEVTGEFLLSLKDEHHAKGFPSLVKRLQEQVKKFREDFNTLHTKLVDVQWSEGEQSGKKKGKKKKKAMNKDCNSEDEQLEQSLHEILGLLQIEAQARKDGAVPKETVDLLSGQVKVVLSENKELKAQVEVVLADNKEIKVHNKELKAQVEVVPADNKELKADNKELKVQMMEHSKNLAVARSVRLRIALEAAHTQLTLDLQRGLGDSTWKEFIHNITPTEKATLLEKLSTKALDLLSTGKSKLNKALHADPTTDIALAVTSVQDKQEAWIEVFKYAYKVDPIALVFNDEEP